ncbi:hypothetical protein SLA2020_015120 [Shorea laevis]
MNSDDFQGNSSLTTSRTQSSQDLLDLVDGDSSDSPISAASTISNPIATKSDLRCSESLASAGAALVEEKIVSGFSSTNTKPSADKIKSTHQAFHGKYRHGYAGKHSTRKSF